jgi:hypothetical protein
MGNCLVTKLKSSVSALLPTLEDYNNSVDLGLPSGTRWMKFNVGATTEQGAGLYFSWGNIDGHSSDYNFGATKADVYDATPGASLAGNIPVNATYDAARANLGSVWRLPTANDVQELYENCNTAVETIDGIEGLRFTSKINGKSIFLPARGFVSTGGSVVDYNVQGLYYTSEYSSESMCIGVWFRTSDGVKNYFDINRFQGKQIRAVAVF